jgi:hypothetical protein
VPGGQSTDWSTRLTAEKRGLTQTAIVRVRCAFGLEPHLVEHFGFCKDPEFVEKVRDIGILSKPRSRS